MTITITKRGFDATQNKAVIYFTAHRTTIHFDVLYPFHFLTFDSAFSVGAAVYMGGVQQPQKAAIYFAALRTPIHFDALNTLFMM